MLDISFTTSLMSELCTAISTKNTTDNECFNSHAQNTTALQDNVPLTGIHRLLIRNKGRWDFPSAKDCQAQLQTPQSVSVVPLGSKSSNPGR